MARLRREDRAIDEKNYHVAASSALISMGRSALLAQCDHLKRSLVEGRCGSMHMASVFSLFVTLRRVQQCLK